MKRTGGKNQAQGAFVIRAVMVRCRSRFALCSRAIFVEKLTEIQIACELPKEVQTASELPTEIQTASDLPGLPLSV